MSMPTLQGKTDKSIKPIEIKDKHTKGEYTFETTSSDDTTIKMNEQSKLKAAVVTLNPFTNTDSQESQTQNKFAIESTKAHTK